MLLVVGALCLLVQTSHAAWGFLFQQPIQPIAPPKVKAPVPPPHPTPEPTEKPVTPDTARPPATDPSSDEPQGKSPIAFPHPLITEVLYAVPGGEKGDANRDGTRHAAGDEFVELVNPHNKPIQLYGYTITDRNPPKKGQLKFTFPSFELPPHGVVVVFNGCEQGWGKSEQGTTIVGNETKPPRGVNPNFHNAYVFTANVNSSRTSWNNSGDYVLVSDPAGNPVECLHWGEFSEPVPAATLTEKAPLTSKASVQRSSLGGVFKEHSGLKVPKSVNDTVDHDGSPSPTDGGNGDVKGKKSAETGILFSPGWFELPKLSNPEKTTKPEATPTTPPTPAPPTSPKNDNPAKPQVPPEKPAEPKRDKKP